jgi:hypothetical protein
LAPSTKKREGKTTSSLGFFLNLIVIVVGVAAPHPQIFHSWRRKRRVDDRLGSLKTHRYAHFVLALLNCRKPLTHLLE